MIGVLDTPLPLTKKEKLEREYKQVCREKRIARTRSAVVRSQLVRAYEILENIRFDLVNDTDFRDRVTSAKRGIESALDDFLMSDNYWEDRVKKFRTMGLDGYKEWKTQPVASK